MNTNKIIGITVGLGVLFAMVWVGSKAWKAGQK